MAKQDPIIEKAVGILKSASLDPQTRMRYEAREKALKDIASIRGDGVREGLEEGMEIGEQKANEATARRLLARKMDIETVVEVTKLDEKRVIEIKRNM